MKDAVYHHMNLAVALAGEAALIASLRKCPLATLCCLLAVGTRCYLLCWLVVQTLEV
jgi:hypothetical protein